MTDEGDEGYESEQHTDPCVKDTKKLADEAAKDLHNVLASAGVSDDLLRNVVQKVQQRGRGGRTPAGDPRLDPNIEPKKAKRILANRLSAAKSKMRQRVLSESLEILKAKENSRNGSVERSDGVPSLGQAPMHSYEPSSGPDELRQVKRLCLDLQAKTREMEARVRVLEAQLAIAASPSLHNPLASTGLRVLSAAPGFPTDNAALLAALTAANTGGGSGGGGGGSGGGPPSARPPLVSSASYQHPGALGLLNLGASAAMQSNLGGSMGALMDHAGRLEAGAGGPPNWVMDGASLGHLMGLPPMALLHQGMGQSLGAGAGGGAGGLHHQSHQGLQMQSSGSAGPSDSQTNSKDAGRVRR